MELRKIETKMKRTRSANIKKANSKIARIGEKRSVDDNVRGLDPIGTSACSPSSTNTATFIEFYLQSTNKLLLQVMSPQDLNAC